MHSLFSHNLLVDGSGGGFAYSHSKDYGCGTGNGVAACIYAGLGGGTGFLGDDDAAPTVNLQTCGGVLDQGGWGMYRWT